MPITKQFLKSKPECKVTFTVLDTEANSIAVAGDFNDWEKAELKKLKNGSFKGAMNIPVDSTYEFKYSVDGEWVNEPEADGFKWNEFAGAENSVLSL
ncbi:AMP-activated protein kinase-like protein [Leeuwenhoekiella aestuarii]|uniref:AMP-activated protein kinase-like protein n=1 Tax=Leeuwenhoekiella aestuarii TaxID=2249426 RepID=A0A4Q0P0P0_9FLAO|nr:isoamylase early set domain-containing protein [Leeuwenhoekiella aestuarii]RXG18445.1 AMP-activated protein kinase-like protein [Leeuwenhoekiella aestuarii]RXG19750.1 AMP-activated protein kinase-like protein [Leeuwenhoekiella aestuarii]